MAALRLFAAARDAAGTGLDDLPGATVADVLDAARARYGSPFVEVLERCQVWRNGEPAELDDPVAPTDEVAVLPPVSGGQFGVLGVPVSGLQSGPLAAPASGGRRP